MNLSACDCSLSCRIYLCKQWHLLKAFTGLLHRYVLLGVVLQGVISGNFRAHWSCDGCPLWQECFFRGFGGNGSKSKVLWTSGIISVYYPHIHIKLMLLTPLVQTRPGQPCTFGYNACRYYNYYVCNSVCSRGLLGLAIYIARDMVGQWP